MRWFKRKAPASRQEIARQLQKTFGDPDASRVAPWVLPAIGFRDGELGSEPDTTGMTRFGGRPDLPDSLGWPVGPDGPLAFLGQVAINEVLALDVDGVLPKQGLISFFFNIRNYAWGTDPSDRDKFAVVHSADTRALRRQDFPDSMCDENRLMQVRRVTPYLRWELPTADPLAAKTLGVGDMPSVSEPARDVFTEKFWDLEWSLAKPHIPVGKHQLLGWANGISAAYGPGCRRICEMCSRDPSTTEVGGRPSDADGSQWRCLLQVGSDRKLYNGTWADGGTIAFMIRDQDLHDSSFERCWCVLSSS